MTFLKLHDLTDINGPSNNFFLMLFSFATSLLILLNFNGPEFLICFKSWATEIAVQLGSDSFFNHLPNPKYYDRFFGDLPGPK